ncbi:MAG: hypothetical protein Q8K85_03365, partial [Hyphomicrobium sp.]|nr:hypothetical protein [Hyphomicrobium sp.]
MRLSAVLLAAGAALALAAPNRPAPAQDLPRNVQVDCNEYALFARRVAILRMVEARLDLVIRDI